MSYQLWVHDEDRISDASASFQKFLKSPSSAEFNVPVIEEKEEEPLPNPEQIDVLERKKSARLTTLLLTVCVLIFFLNGIQARAAQGRFLFFTPIQTLLLFDVPPQIELLAKPMSEAELKTQMETLEKEPMWRGFYEWVVLKIKTGSGIDALGPTFIKIREGELWRFFSPCVLHRDFLHILFNMIWLWILGRPIEMRIGVFKTLLLTVVGGVGSNTLQYLMSGPFFIGYSGVVMVLAAFIWMREKVAPWEGYPLHRTTVLFLLLYVGSMFAIQTGSFFLQVFTQVEFAPSIANTAHVSGGLIGLALGRLSLFSQKVAK
jgi:GlpG protein